MILLTSFFFISREYFKVLGEAIRTNPYRKAATAMASVMSKHGIAPGATDTLGKVPPPGIVEKRCALTKALRHAHSCNVKLNATKEEIQAMCCDVERPKSQPPSSAQPESSQSEKAIMTGHLLTLVSEAQTTSKRIYETAVGLHICEDFLRQPDDLRILDFSRSGRIQIPNYNLNHASQLCLEWLYSTAVKWVKDFREENKKDTKFIAIFENFTKATKEYLDAVTCANQVFRVMLYPNDYGRECLQEYVTSLGHVLRNDIMMEVQSLRRAFDSIQYSFERLGWAASIAWMKFSGQKITVETLNQKGIQADYSTFQHKFYEGPSKGKGRKVTLDPATVKPGSAVNAAIKSLSQTSVEKPAKAEKKKSRKKVLDTAVNLDPIVESFDTFKKTKVAGQMSASVTGFQEVSKVKKIKKKLKAKPKTADDLPSESSGVYSLPSVGGLPESESNSTVKLTPLVDETGEGVTVSLPPNLRKQFGEVFGTHLIPKKPKKKKPKKKVNAKGDAKSKLEEVAELQTPVETDAAIEVKQIEILKEPPPPETAQEDEAASIISLES